ncbi:discoidin domain-containing protein [Paenibacillus ehimensis]|uniref:discoidin domain-containing protein n=1 Tax=Paenibacillus ehimensis TaxID=79264 RepID=UPI002DBEDFA1|nr:discoidin domain-containing protein [Paenibacillus ehimensis]MEC0210254.1 discoidin domain-containing protein [Paenibacillus ehimensis]
MAVVITSNKIVDIEQGIKTNVELVDGKLQLGVSSILLGQLIDTNCVPIMTSNNNPSPIVISASNEYDSTYLAYKAFDGSSTSRWATRNVPAWLSVDFNKEKIITKYTLVGFGADINQNLKTWTFEGSNDNSNWFILDTQINISGWQNNVKKSFQFENSTKYRYYRINISQVGNGSVGTIVEMELMEKVDLFNYFSRGNIEFSTYDLGQFFRQVKSISSIKNIPTGTEVRVYTSTSNDGIIFSPYSLTDTNGLITSPQGRFIKTKVELIGKSETQIITLNNFTSQEISQFQPDDQILFDSGLQLKTVYLKNIPTDSAWNENGSLYRKSLEKSVYRQIDKIEVI